MYIYVYASSQRVYKVTYQPRYVLTVTKPLVDVEVTAELKQRSSRSQSAAEAVIPVDVSTSLLNSNEGDEARERVVFCARVSYLVIIALVYVGFILSLPELWFRLEWPADFMYVC